MANGSTPKMTAQDKEWMAKQDVSTLTEAKMIMGDKTRMAAAKQMASKMAEEAKKHADNMNSVANGDMGMMNGKAGNPNKTPDSGGAKSNKAPKGKSPAKVKK